MSECLFCRIANKEIPSKMVYEDDELFVIEDINPQAPEHLLLIPKKHIERIADLEEADRDLVGGLIYRASKIAEERGFAEAGYRLIFNSGIGAGQTVFHIHLHLLGGRKMAWPPG